MTAFNQLHSTFKRFGYFSNKKGEVDFFSPKNWAVEVKWSEIPNDLSRAYLDLKTPEKIVWVKNNFLLEYPSGPTVLKC